MKESDTAQQAADDVELGDLIAEEVRLIQQVMQFVDREQALLHDAERFRTGPDADHERFVQVCDDYAALYAEHRQVQMRISALHAELGRRGGFNA